MDGREGMKKGLTGLEDGRWRELQRGRKRESGHKRLRFAA